MEIKNIGKIKSVSIKDEIINRINGSNIKITIKKVESFITIT